MVTALPACDCGKLAVGGSPGFERCAASDPPASRTFHAGALSLQIDERVLTVSSKEATVEIVAFTGPIGGPLTRSELAQVSDAAPELVIMLGGLGDTEEAASTSLAGLSALAVSTVFIPGGADHREIVEDAFDGLTNKDHDLLVNGSGLRELRIGRDSFAILPGAAFGRYARDDESCGFDATELESLSEAFEAHDKQRLWLLSWEAPAGWGLSAGLGGTETASPALRKAVDDMKITGGLFAFPENAVGVPSTSPAGGLAWVVPRLGRTGATRTSGGRVASGVASLTLGPTGLIAR
jgi:hypothetical protein